MTERVMTAAQIRAAEKEAFLCGLNEDILIENAAAAMTGEIMKRVKSGRVLVVAGSGNNAADGLSAARLLLLAGRKADVFACSDAMNAAAEARLKAFKAVGGITLDFDEARMRAGDYALIVDAVLGIGLSRPAEGNFLRAVRLINGSNVPVLSADIPSGLSADSGEVLGEAVKADVTVTFSAYKYGQFLGVGADYCGSIVLKDLGVRGEGGALFCSADSPRLPSREKVSHKGVYGRVKIIGGSPTMTGAPLIAAESALKSGAGLVTLCAARSMQAAYSGRVKEATLCAVNDTDGYICDKYAVLEAVRGADAAAIGMGMGENPYLREIIGFLAHNYEGTLIIDADGLNCLVGGSEILKGHICSLVLTPHRGEFYRLFGQCGESEIVDRTVSAAKNLNAVIVNKSNATVITDGNTVYINAEGSPAMAKGGSGDALSGAIAALSVRLGALKGAARACFQNGRAARKAAERLGEDAVLASDAIAEIRGLK